MSNLLFYLRYPGNKSHMNSTRKDSSEENSKACLIALLREILKKYSIDEGDLL